MTLPYLVVACLSGIYLQSVLPPEPWRLVLTLPLAAANTILRAGRWQVRTRTGGIAEFWRLHSAGHQAANGRGCCDWRKSSICAVSF